jgi:hypothetical protein
MKYDELTEQKGIAGEYRCEEKVVKKVIHEKPPLYETRFPVTSDRSVKRIGNILKHDHYRCAPQPNDVPFGKITEKQYQAAPQNGGKRKMVTFDEHRNPGCHIIDPLSFYVMQK